MPYIQENEEDVYTSLLPNSIPLFFSVNESPGFVNHCPVLLRDFISLHLFPCRISMVCRVSLHIIQVSYKALVCPHDWLAKLLQDDTIPVHDTIFCYYLTFNTAFHRTPELHILSSSIFLCYMPTHVYQHLHQNIFPLIGAFI